MIDEDDAIDIMERLRDRLDEGAGRVLAGAVVLRRDRRVLAFASADAAADLAAREPSPGCRWSLGLTDWGRLEMSGDIEAAAQWLSRAGRGW